MGQFYSVACADVDALQDFEARKKMLVERSTQKHIVPRKLTSLDKDISSSPFLQVCVVSEVSMSLTLSEQALAEREELLRSGKLTTILFIRDFNNKVRSANECITICCLFV